MLKIVIVDTSALIIFHKIGNLDLLHKIDEKIITTPEVAAEFGETLPSWITIQAVSDQKYQKILETQIDSGEASVLALASEFENIIVILDDLKARKLAQKLNFKTTGTLGIIIKAKQLLIIPKVKPILEKLLQTNFRIAQNIIDEILILNNE